jgi:hypothetical protein
MNDMLISLLTLARDTVRQPKEGARRVLSLPLPPRAAWEALGLVLVLSLLLAYLTTLLLGAAFDPMVPGFAPSPLLAGLIQGGSMLVMIGAIHGVGRMMGGSGTLEGAVRLTALLQFIMLLLQAVQVVFLLVLPPVADLIGLLSVGLMLWLLTNFIAVLHGFRSLMGVFVMILVTTLVLSFVLVFLLSLFGVSLPMEMSHV